VSKARGYYCSKSCDMLHRRQNAAFEARRRAGWAKAMETNRAKFADRLRGRLIESFQSVFDVHPEWTEADRVAILRAGAKLWTRAHLNGWNASQTRMRRKGAAA
jgi:hypothetical protein